MIADIKADTAFNLRHDPEEKGGLLISFRKMALDDIDLNYENLSHLKSIANNNSGGNRLLRMKSQKTRNKD